jgi:hypothetical protein
LGTAYGTEPVDCREACPTNPEVARAEAAATWLEGRLFTHSEGQMAGIYRTRALCEADTGHAFLRLEVINCEAVLDP